MNRLKALKLTILIGLLVFFLPATSNAVKVSTVPIRINHLEVNFTDEMGHPLLTKTNRTLVPLRIISEYLGYEIDWSKDTWNQGIQKVWISNKNNDIEFELGKSTAKVNGQQRAIDIQDGKAVNTKVIVHNGRTYVPLRFVVEALGAEIKYESTFYGPYTQIITKEEITYTNPEAKFPLKYPELIPAGAKLIYSKVTPGFYEFHEYEYTVKLSGEAYTNELYINFSKDDYCSVNLGGKDLNGEMLSFEYSPAKPNVISFNWRIPDLTDEDKQTLKRVAEQVAEAYGQ